MAHETAGDPVSGLKWTRRTTAKLADELRGLGINVCPQTVARLLKAMGYSLRVNHKKLAGASHPNRDEQFRHITKSRERCAADNIPLISVDTKKKELVGAFRNPGAKWDRSPELVNDHDFRSEAEGLAVPYGIYDPRANAGTVFVGRTADTPAFAVDCIEKWWRTEGRGAAVRGGGCGGHLPPGPRWRGRDRDVECDEVTLDRGGTRGRAVRERAASPARFPDAQDRQPPEKRRI